MTTRRSVAELGLWGVIALAGGAAIGWVDSTSTEVQGSVLLLMLLNFGLTIPGRAPIALTALASAAGLPLVYALRLHAWNPGMVIAVVPAFIAAGGGSLFGRLLDIASSQLVERDVPAGVAPFARPLSLRFVLGSALVAIAIAGIWSVRASLAEVDSPVALFLSLVWQTMTLVGWTALAPVILRQRPRVGSTGEDTTGLTASDVALHVAIVLALTTVHAAAIVGATAALSIPITPGWPEMARTAFASYLPLDAAAYLTIVALGYASDVERHRRLAAQRERALRTEAAESRLSALRAQLNPHFLYNALNSVDVLAQSGGGRAGETSRLVQGITSLLRYVLDDRRANVPFSEELDFAWRYLTVQQARFGSRLRVDVVTDGPIDTLPVPQLLLQPLIENAVEHGIARTLDGGTVSIVATRDDRSLLVTIENDGPAPTAENSQSGVGLANTRERLDRLFGSAASLTVETRDEPRPGTRVVLRLPIAEAASAA
jgi:hypothetical protein